MRGIRGDGHVKMEANIGAACLKAMEYRGSLMVTQSWERSMEQILSQSLSKGYGPADTLILDFLASTM